MCTAATYKTDGFYFGRTLDYEFSYGDEIVVMPRRFPLAFRGGAVGVLVEDGVENVAVDGIHVPGLIKKDEVVRKRRCRNTTPCSAWRMWPTAVRSTMTR